MIPEHWPLPLRLLIALLRVDDSAAADADVLARGMSAADWSVFADLAISRHGVAQSVGQGLGALDVPEPISTRFADVLRNNAMLAMAHMAETRRINQALDAIGVKPVVFKGWALAEHLYGRVDARQVGDLDLLVPEDRVADSYAALQGIGFEISADTAMSRRRLSRLDDPSLMRACKHIAMVRPQTGLVVELHWRLMTYHGWPELVDAPGALVTRESTAGPLLMPSDQVNMIYLSTHGALHIWDRLKWLEDIARLARQRGPDQLTRDVEAARAVGLERPVEFALVLAGQLLNSPVPPELERADPDVVRLVDWTLDRLSRSDRPFSLRSYQLGVRWMTRRLARNWRQRLGLIEHDTVRRLRLASLDLLPRRRKS